MEEYSVCLRKPIQSQVLDVAVVKERHEKNLWRAERERVYNTKGETMSLSLSFFLWALSAPVMKWPSENNLQLITRILLSQFPPHRMLGMRQ